MATIDGTVGNDLFLYNPTPNAGGDLFRMGDGNDLAFANMGDNSYFGGNGIDAVSYRFADTGVALNLALGGTGGFADGHSYNSIEKIFGSNFDDSITGSFGSDFLYGGLGSDTINGSDGNDRIFGQDGNDILNGGNGNDYIEGGAGGDIINGGTGIDTVGFSTFRPELDDDGNFVDLDGVDVDLATPPPQGEPLDSSASNDAQGDFYISVENISGSAFDDTLRGDSGSNTINGRAGDDLIVGRGGNDRLIGGLGDDRIFGGQESDYIHGGDGDDDINASGGNDRIYLGAGEDLAQGGNGNDFFYLTNDGEVDEVFGGTTDFEGGTTDTGYDTVSYIQATSGVQVFLGGLILLEPPRPLEAEPLDEPLNMPIVEEDILVGIERLIGSNFGDAIFGGFGDETIFGGNGDDLLVGGGGRDRLIGGSGADEFGFFIGGGDTDSILDFVQGVDTITFRTFDEGLTEAAILATLIDYGAYFVFEFGLGDGPVEQRLAVIKDDPDQVLTVDDFTIELIDDFPLDPPPVQEPLAEDFAGQNFATDDMAFYDFDALI